MSTDTDAFLPAPVKDFVFDLHDTTRRSLIVADQATLYSATFRDLNSKYFEKSAWPSPDAVASECESDTLFLALYKELTHRHYLSYTRPKVRDHIDGWNVYRSLFDAILAASEEESGSDSRGLGLILAPDWAFDILHEFVYQFQGFCQFRTTFASNLASKGGGSLPDHQSDTLEMLKSNKDVWAVETVMYYLHRLLSFVDSANPSLTSGHKMLGMFASVALSRLECLLGDYQASLVALQPLLSSNRHAKTDEVVSTVFAAKLSLAYHASVSYLMLRRYKDAIAILGDMCGQINRGVKTGQLSKKQPGGDQMVKNFDRMITLLAILTHIAPAGRVDDQLARLVRERYGNSLAKVEAGEEGYEDLFMFACPKFVNPAVPDYEGTDDKNSSSQDVYKLQVKQFMSEMNQQQILRKLRSYMKLYTSIDVQKLAAFNDAVPNEFLSCLLSYKHKMRQMERGSGDDVDGGIEDAPLLEGKIGSALDIHYFIEGDTIHVDEAEKQRRFEHFFLTQISLAGDIMKDLEEISTTV